ncbi:hypothetical protein LAZ67_5000085 [Cordylochernes scorpioides]|uniref:Band 7 domain-containing protein n=1 Tax=Cordylochernes scorpioides TaxID=51811 RepID=A0ABY6KI39_9ARAC|nr:hypothetical protein LAZ67_5000085 [Cordylochernes scorpioides]
MPNKLQVVHTTNYSRQLTSVVLQVVQEYERAVIFRLGRLVRGGARGPGIFFIIPCIDTYCKVDLRTVSFDVPPQETELSDGVATDSLQGQRDGGCGRRGVLPDLQRHHRRVQRGGLRPLHPPAGRHHPEERPGHPQPVRDPLRAGVHLPRHAEQLGRGHGSLGRQGGAGRDVSTHLHPPVIPVEGVVIKLHDYHAVCSKDVRLPVQLQRAMAAEAEAAREARAKVIAAEGEQRASKALKEAADVIIDAPAALQLRYLQTLGTIAAEKNSTIVFPIPLELFKGFGINIESKNQ